MVYRVFVEKKPGFAHEAETLLEEAVSFLGTKNLKRVRVINRYDAEGIPETIFNQAVGTVFSEPQVDLASETVDLDGSVCFAVEYLPGQFDQRADSAAQCIQILSRTERPLIRSAKIYALYGDLTEQEISDIKKYVINPVEAREASMELPQTLRAQYEIPTAVKTLDGFRDLDEASLNQFIRDYGLAMDEGDLAFCRNYFRAEHRDPTITEIRMIDTYWSDHCRHTTFHTIIDQVTFADPLLQKAYDRYLSVRKELNRTKPICLMDLATIAVRYLRKAGKLDKLDESEEINACTVKMNVQVDGREEPWLLLFKNETHNHPTEIEPFGGAATCIGGAIRDPLSGRAYVYGAMRVTGAADPTRPVSETIPGKLPQRKIVTTAAAGYSSYGNQIGLATGIVDEVYHPGYAAKRMEIGAVIAAAPQENVRRERPAPGDVVILLGGSTGRDGIGGATGASKAHNVHSVETCGAEVQKGNAPIERKLQRLFRRKDAATKIKRCNDFGAGGVSVAIGELADGLEIDLNAVPKKYEGLDGTELAISESQERMAVVVDPKDVDAFLAIAAEENLQAVKVAVVTELPRLVLNWNGKKIVDISREFLDSNGAEKHITIQTRKPDPEPVYVRGSFRENYERLASDLNCCSHRGLAERFDATIGAGTVLMPFGGKNQLTPAQAMVQKISVERGHTDLCSLMAYGFDPERSSQSPYHGAYLAVIHSVCKLIASGADFRGVYLTLQEYFAKPGRDPERWGDPLSALLGAFQAQMDLGIGAIGGKDSMSGTFEQLDVPPTLVSFAVTTQEASEIVSPETKQAGDALVLLTPVFDAEGLPTAESMVRILNRVSELRRSGIVRACYAPGFGGIAEAVMKMSFGNGFGVRFEDSVELTALFRKQYGSFVLEVTKQPEDAVLLGFVTDAPELSWRGEKITLSALSERYEERLESVYPSCAASKSGPAPTLTSDPKPVRHCPISCVKPRVLIPVFPGTNCEYDSAKAVADGGAVPEIFVINNRTAEDINRSIEGFAARLRESQMLFLPGGFSGGDEPDGSGKFITAFIRNPEIRDGVTDLFDVRGGLILGICNGFQALIKLGLIPFGRIVDADENSPTLTYNTIGRHQSRIVRTRIVSTLSPWLSMKHPGNIVNVPISHGEGRIVAPESLLEKLAAQGQIATQYVDLDGLATNDVRFNPNDSMLAIEGLSSPDGRILGKMGHSERIGTNLYKNVPGSYETHLFEAAVRFFQKG